MAVETLLFHNYDVPGTNYVYGYYSDVINAPKYLKTSGSSTTVTELNSGDNVFAGYGVGDLLHVNVDGTWTSRVVSGVGSIPDEVTVSSAVDWENGGNGRAFSFRRFTSGTAATSGWINVGDFRHKTVTVFVSTFNVATSIDLRIQGRLGVGSTVQPVEIYSKSYTAAHAAATGGEVIPITEDVSQIRVGFNLTGADSGANEVYAYLRLSNEFEV